MPLPCAFAEIATILLVADPGKLAAAVDFLGRRLTVWSGAGRREDIAHLKEDAAAE